MPCCGGGIQRNGLISSGVGICCGSFGRLLRSGDKCLSCGQAASVNPCTLLLPCAEPHRGSGAEKVKGRCLAVPKAAYPGALAQYVTAPPGWRSKTHLFMVPRCLTWPPTVR